MRARRTIGGLGNRRKLGPHGRFGQLGQLALLVCAALASPMAASEARLQVIVHPSRAGEVSLRELRAIYLKQKVFWSDGSPIVAINREAGSAPRELFSSKVFGQTTRELAAYWNQRYFEAGEFPPATLASDDAVLRFVAGNRNAIGYVLAEKVGAEVSVALALE
jgi:ABC-type phosphate transport system substrate-binding protein